MAQLKAILGIAALVSATWLLQARAKDDVPPTPDSVSNQQQNRDSKNRSASKGDANSPEGRRNGDASRTEKSKDNSDLEMDAADVKELLLSAATFVKAYNTADAKTIANQFAPNAEYVDEQGYRFHGRAAIEQSLTACLSAHKGAEVDLVIHSIRLVAPGVAIEDGTTTVNSDKLSEGPIETNYVAVHVKADAKWQTVSVRETAPSGRHEHANKSKLRQLSWLLGDWVDEGEDTLVVSSCKPIQGGNFLLREFKLHVAGREVVSGEQRIGWDAASGRFKSWVFDSNGGNSEGFWENDENRWILKTTGVSNDGQPASCTTIYTLIDDNTVTWQTVDHEVGGEKIPDSEVITIVRRAPMPTQHGDSVTSQER